MASKHQGNWLPVSVVLCGAVLSTLFFAAMHIWEQKRSLDIFKNDAEDHFLIIEREIDQDLLVLASLKAFYGASLNVTREEFREFASPLLMTHKSIQALEWVPRVPYANRPAYEAQARSDGYIGFGFNELDSRSQAVSAGVRAEYFPVYYVEPYKGNEPALGFDLASQATRKKAIDESRDTGEIVATARIRLVQERGDQFGFLVFMPVYGKGLPIDSIAARRAALHGFVLGVFRVGSIVEKSLSGLKPDALGIALYDESAPKAKQFLYYHAYGQPSEPPPSTKHAYSKTVDIAGRRWLFTSIPMNRGKLAEGGYGPWTVLLAGFLLTAIIAKYFRDNAKRIRVVENLVAERSRELEKTNEALKQSEAEYRTIFESMEDLYTRTDAEGIIRVVSPSLYRLSGFQPEELVGRPAIDFYAQTGSRDALLDLLVKQRHVKDYEVQLKKKDGSVLSVSVGAQALFDSEGHFSGVAAVLRDVSERKKLEEERAKLSSAVERAGEGVFMLTLDRRYSYVNEAFCKTYGFTREELLGNSTETTQSDRHPQSFHDLIYSELQAGNTWSGRQTRKRKDGAIVEAEITIAPVRNESGVIIHYVGINRDITGQLRTEQQLRQSHKMEAIGTLAGGIAHDFNNILAIILGNAELALDDTPQETNGIRHNLDAIFKAARRGRDLVKQILTFSRKSEQRQKNQSLTPLIEESFELLRASIPSTIEMKLTINTKSDTARVNEAQFQQIIVNLCSNAAHAMQEKSGLLEMSLEDETLRLDDSPNPRRYLKVTVSDTGTGMDEEVRKRIFDPFFTTKGPGEGTGMGLAVVYGIVEAHNGLITVHSEPGKGSSFSVFLPKARTAAARTEAPEDVIAGGNERLMFVDDEDGIIEMASPMLERLGYKVASFTDPEAAFDAFAEAPGDFDLIITDQTMPKMTGLVLAGKLKAIRPDIPVMLCTGYSQAISAETTKAAGIGGYVMKPIARKELAEAIRKVLDHGGVY